MFVVCYLYLCLYYTNYIVGACGSIVNISFACILVIVITSTGTYFIVYFMFNQTIISERLDLFSVFVPVITDIGHILCMPDNPPSRDMLGNVSKVGERCRK